MLHKQVLIRQGGENTNAFHIWSYINIFQVFNVNFKIGWLILFNNNNLKTFKTFSYKMQHNILQLT